MCKRRSILDGTVLSPAVVTAGGTLEIGDGCEDARAWLAKSAAENLFAKCLTVHPAGASCARGGPEVSMSVASAGRVVPIILMGAAVYMVMRAVLRLRAEDDDRLADMLAAARERVSREPHPPSADAIGALGAIARVHGGA